MHQPYIGVYVRDGEQTGIVRILDDFLARAFCGELGTNDPSEESAVELLKGTLRKKTR